MNGSEWERNLEQLSREHPEESQEFKEWAAQNQRLCEIIRAARSRRGPDGEVRLGPDYIAAHKAERMLFNKMVATRWPGWEPD